MAMAESTNIFKRGIGAIKFAYNAVQSARKAVANEERKQRQLQAFYSQRNAYLRNMYAFNGEKNLGGIGVPRDYLLDHETLRSRGNQFYMDNEVVQIIVNRMADWTIGNGLKLECEPNELILQSEGIKLDIQRFSDLVEARINTLGESRETTYSRMRNRNQEERRGFISSSNGGGILVVLRLRNGVVNYELIDGSHVRHFAGGTDLNPTLLSDSSRICNGIEMDNAGKHIAYYVYNASYEYQRILARSLSTGLTMAFMYGGSDTYIDVTRTIPILSGLFQTLSQMDEYKGETLKSAKEQNAIAYQAVPELKASGENVFSGIVAGALDVGANDGTLAVDSQLTAIADKVAVSTGSKAFAMPPGTEIKPLGKNEAELYFKDFWSTLFEVACAAAGMPPNVALQRFDTSFSSARAAIKDWEHSLLLKRYSHGTNFLQPGYELQLHVDILTGKIQAPGYLTAFRDGNELVLAAYRQTRWVGDNVPHIDPVKEVQAEREKLGTAMAHVPLTTQKKATEALNGGSSKLNTIDAGNELKDCETNGIKPAAAVDAEFAPKPAPFGGPKASATNGAVVAN